VWHTGYPLAVPTREHTADFLTLAGAATVRFSVQSTPVVFFPDAQSFLLFCSGSNGRLSALDRIRAP
jgi:hypothetical protein